MDDQTLTAWEVYWVIQADQIAKVLAVSAIAASVVMAVGLIPLFLSFCENEISAKAAHWIRHAWFLFCPLTVLLITATSLMPTTKSVSAIIILPAVANGQDVAGQANEICELANQALMDMVKKDDDE